MAAAAALLRLAAALLVFLCSPGGGVVAAPANGAVRDLLSAGLPAGKAPVNAVELLTAFSGDRAKQYERFFRFSKETRIVAVEIHAVGMNSTTARYTSRGEWGQLQYAVNNILRITTAGGFEGISGVDSYYEAGFSNESLLELKSVATDILALQSVDPVVVGTILERTRPDLSDASRSSIDIALWDLAARRANIPLCELLGAERDSIEPYASFSFYDTLPKYVEEVNEYAKLGYKTFKFHVWGLIDKDSQVVELVQQTFANTSYRFMLDLENAYGFDDALKLGGETDKFVWLEAPIDDALLEQYAQLRGRLAVPIIPSGDIIYSPEFIRQGIKTGSWDAGRFGATVVGGISKALELLIIANDAGLPIEMQSWGYSLTQIANLHPMLANKRTRYFEAPMPKDAFEFGMKNGNLLHRGRVLAPKGPGLGIEVDWKQLVTADFYVKVVAALKGDQ